MRTEDDGTDGEYLSLLTIPNFISLAAERGKTLWTETKGAGITFLTDGRRRYILPLHLPRGRMPSALVESLCCRFDLPRLDFALDPKDDD